MTIINRFCILVTVGNLVAVAALDHQNHFLTTRVENLETQLAVETQANKDVRAVMDHASLVVASSLVDIDQPPIPPRKP